MGNACCFAFLFCHFKLRWNTERLLESLFVLAHQVSLSLFLLFKSSKHDTCILSLCAKHFAEIAQNIPFRCNCGWTLARSLFMWLHILMSKRPRSHNALRSRVLRRGFLLLGFVLIFSVFLSFLCWNFLLFFAYYHQVYHWAQLCHLSSSLFVPLNMIYTSVGLFTCSPHNVKESR